MITTSNRLVAALAVLPLALVGCGDDDNGNGGGTPDAAPQIDGDVLPGTCPEHPNVTEMSGVCAITGGQNSPVTADLTLTADVDWLLNGPVFIGNDTDATVLTIPAGTTIYGGAGSFLLIQRGSKIMANGTAQAPIVFTSAKAPGSRGPEDWGGLVINGRAPINNGDASGEAPGEAGTGTYGGNQAGDSSGVLKYVRVEFAGNKVDAENELNGIAFQGVGSGTQVEYIQTHLTSDDGVEFFGGTVNVKYLVVTGSDDDSIDWTGGWSGNIQFAMVMQMAESGPEAERGIEADNLEANHSATPYSSPTLSNITFISRPGNNAAGVVFRRGTKGELHNSIITGFGGPCVAVNNDQTIANVGDGSLVVNNLVLDCAGGDFNGDGAALATGANVVSADPQLEDWQPKAGSPALGIGASPSGGFFTATNYAGALDGSNDWTAGWVNLDVN